LLFHDIRIDLRPLFDDIHKYVNILAKFIVILILIRVFLRKFPTCGEMDITTVFGTVIPGSSPGRWTIKKHTFL
jgi:hypothetical protein